MDPTAQRLLETLEMWEDGVQIMRENLRRRSPHASEAQIEAELGAWLDRPEELDPSFVRVDWPSRRRDLVAGLDEVRALGEP